MSDHEQFDKGFEDGRRGKTSASDDHNYRLGYQAGCAMHGIPASKERAMAFIGADMALGMYEQSFAQDREHLLAYAVEEGHMWALPEFLALHGWLDADWVARINGRVT